MNDEAVASTPLEILKEFNRLFLEYDRRRDDELNFLADHPNRDYWDDEQEAEYAEILSDIDTLYADVSNMSDRISKM